MRKSDFIFRYRVRNWRDYNRALVRRSSITFWVDEQAVRSWCSEKVPGARGRPQLYAGTVIERALIVKAVFHLSLRSTQGFLESVVQLMGSTSQSPTTQPCVSVSAIFRFRLALCLPDSRGTS